MLTVPEKLPKKAAAEHALRGRRDVKNRCGYLFPFVDSCPHTTPAVDKVDTLTAHLSHFTNRRKTGPGAAKTLERAQTHRSYSTQSTVLLLLLKTPFQEKDTDPTTKSVQTSPGP